MERGGIQDAKGRVCQRLDLHLVFKQREPRTWFMQWDDGSWSSGPWEDHPLFLGAKDQSLRPHWCQALL